MSRLQCLLFISQAVRYFSNQTSNDQESDDTGNYNRGDDHEESKLASRGIPFPAVTSGQLQLSSLEPQEFIPRHLVLKQRWSGFADHDCHCFTAFLLIEQKMHHLRVTIGISLSRALDHSEQLLLFIC